MKTVNILPAEKIAGEITPPGDKSISHRVAMLSGLALGKSVIDGFLHSEDCLNTVKAMTAMGAKAEFSADGRVIIEGTGGKLSQPATALDVGNSGTSIRLLSGLVAGHPITVELTGDASLCSRPMKRIQEPLKLMGAQVELLGEGGRAPVRIHGGKLHGIEYRAPVASAQIKSCILLAGLFAEGRTVIIEPALSRDHTERLFRELHLNLREKGTCLELDGYGPFGPAIAGRRWVVPGDISSAAFFIVAAACRPGAEICVRGVGLNPRRAALLDVLKRMGADIVTTPPSLCAGPPLLGKEGRLGSVVGEPVGDVIVRGKRLSGTQIGGQEVPFLIDELPILAVAGALADGQTVIRDAAELRVKESDRIKVMAENLKKMGVTVAELADGLVIEGAKRIGTREDLQGYGDHRMIMSMAILGLAAVQPTKICDVACVDTSYPSFWNDLEKVGGHVDWSE